MSNTEINTVTKICTVCHEEKPITEFYKKHSNKDRRNSRCKKCTSIRLKIRYQENKEHMVAVRKIWRDANPEKNNAYRKAWRKANPERSALHSRNRSAKKKEAIGTHTAVDIQNLFTLQRKKCAVCLKPITKGYHVDHIVAIINGGSNDKYNLQLLCEHCNCTKRSKDPIRFMNENGKLI